MPVHTHTYFSWEKRPAIYQYIDEWVSSRFAETRFAEIRV